MIRWEGGNPLQSRGIGHKFGAMIGKCDQYKRSLASKPGQKSLLNVRCHVLRRWMQNKQAGRALANDAERKILDGNFSGRSNGLWRRHIDRHYNAITPRTYALFFRKMAENKLLSNAQRSDLLRHMGSSSRFRGNWTNNGSTRPALFDQHVTKNGRTYRNKSWVVFTWDWLSDDDNYNGISPQHGFVFFTEDHSEHDDANDDTANNTARALYDRILPLLE